MPRLSAEKMKERRRRIAHAAYRCFVRDGYAAASVDAICGEAGISKGAFYVHFASKEALVHAVAELRAEEIGPLPGDTAEALADTIVDTLLASMLDTRAARFEMEGMSISIGDAVLTERLIANLEAIGARIAEAIERVTGEGGARSGICATQAAAIVEAYCLGQIFRAALWTPEAIEDVRASMRRLIAGLLG